MPRNFMQLLQAQQDKGNFVCVGLDSDQKRLPGYLVTKYNGYLRAQIEFNRSIIDATKDFAGAYKPNLAFYPDASGKTVLKSAIDYIRQVAPDVPVILDAKQGDIGNTNNGYVFDDFGYYGADAATVHNYMGMEAMRPFLDNPDKGVIVLCRTSNPGAGEFQDLHVPVSYDTAVELGLGTAEEAYLDGLNYRSATVPLYLFVAGSVAYRWNYNGNCCIVVGATVPTELAQVRAIIGDMPILLPGIGAQGGDLEATIDAGKNSKGQGMIINNSRGIIFAYEKDDEYGEDQFGLAARKAGLAMHHAIREHLGLPYGQLNI